MTPDIGLIAAVLAAIFGPLFAYIAANRRLSGKIGTSEASSLWEESASIREDYRQRLASSEVRMAKLEERVAEEERANTKLTRENYELAAQNAECLRTIDGLKVRLDEMERANVLLKETIVSIGNELKE